MQFISLLKKNRLVLLILVFILLILAVIGIIFYIDSSNKNNSFSTIGTDLKDYAELKQKINELVQLDSSLGQASLFIRMTKKLQLLEEPNASEKEKYQAVIDSSDNLQSLYTSSHDPRVKDVFNLMVTFAKENFPAQFKRDNFATLYCQDTTCQDEPQPQEIMNIIDEIKASKVADYSKDSHIQNLINVGYVSKNDAEVKANSYILMADLIRQDGEFVASGVGDKFADKIIEYVKNKYPEAYKKLRPEKTGQ